MYGDLFSALLAIEPGGAITPRDLLLAASRASGDVILLLTSFCP